MVDLKSNEDNFQKLSFRITEVSSNIIKKVKKKDILSPNYLITLHFPVDGSHQDFVIIHKKFQ